MATFCLALDQGKASSVVPVIGVYPPPAVRSRIALAVAGVIPGRNRRLRLGSGRTRWWSRTRRSEFMLGGDTLLAVSKVVVPADLLSAMRTDSRPEEHTRARLRL